MSKLSDLHCNVKIRETNQSIEDLSILVFSSFVIDSSYHTNSSLSFLNKTLREIMYNLFLIECYSKEILQ